MLRGASARLIDAIGPLPVICNERNLGFVVNRKDVVRLTASSNKPSIKAARQAVMKSGRVALLGDVTLRIFHPFRMNMIYVAENRGVPFLNLADVMSSRYCTVNFISPRTQGFEDYLLEYGWTLISRDGTIGKVSFVGRYLEGTATNQHISRLVPDTTKIPPGYLYAFMVSPYAQLQIEALIYGSVILGVHEKELGGILIPLLDKSVMQTIGNIVEHAFDNRYEANQLEDKAQSLLIDALGVHKLAAKQHVTSGTAMEAF